MLLDRRFKGWKHPFATNYLEHFGLAVGLHDALAHGAARQRFGDVAARF